MTWSTLHHQATRGHTRESSTTQREPSIRADFALPASQLPTLLTRMRATPVQLARVVLGVHQAMLTNRLMTGRSALDHIAHLTETEVLWHARLDDLASGAAVLRASQQSCEPRVESRTADPDAVRTMLHTFYQVRTALAQRIAEAPTRVHAVAALHPRLGIPVTLAGQCQMVLDHDQRHLRTIARVLLRGQCSFSAEPVRRITGVVGIDALGSRARSCSDGRPCGTEHPPRSD